jgi:hypothetical protein
MNTDIRTYTELMSFETFEDRLRYLMLKGNPSEETFGGLRSINQRFYSSREWRSVRNSVVVRDGGYDLGLVDRPITGDLYVHHMNPLTPQILVHSPDLALDPEFLITVSFETHSAIHYAKVIPKFPVEHIRTPGDTKLW